MTAFELIAAAYPLHAQRIAEAIFEHNGEKLFAEFMTRPNTWMRNAGEALQCAFCWGATVEGHEYWSRLRSAA